jgi:hypothetical protein
VYVANKWRPPKADAPFSSLFVDVVYFGVSNGNQPARRAITKRRAPDLDPSGVVEPTAGAGAAAAMEIEGRAAGG